MHGSRAGLAGMGVLLLAGGLLLLGDMLDYWTFPWQVAAPVALVALGLMFFVGAARKRTVEVWEQREGAPNWAMGPWELHQGPGHRTLQLYWMAVMGVFFFLLAGIMLLRSQGTSLSYGVIGPFFILAVGGMFLVRALACRREHPPVPRDAP